MVIHSHPRIFPWIPGPISWIDQTLNKNEHRIFSRLCFFFNKSMVVPWHAIRRQSRLASSFKNPRFCLLVVLHPLCFKFFPHLSLSPICVHIVLRIVFRTHLGSSIFYLPFEPPELSQWRSSLRLTRTNLRLSPPVENCPPWRTYRSLQDQCCFWQ